MDIERINQNNIESNNINEEKESDNNSEENSESIKQNTREMLIELENKVNNLKNEETIEWIDMEKYLEHLEYKIEKNIEYVENTRKKIWNFKILLKAIYISDKKNYPKIEKEYFEQMIKLNYMSLETVDSFNSWLDEKTRELNNWEHIDLNDKYKVISFVKDIDITLASIELTDELFYLTKISQEEINTFIEDPSINIESIKNILWEEKYIELSKSISNEINNFSSIHIKKEILIEYIKWLKQTNDWNWYEGENKLIEMFSDIEWIGYLNANDLIIDHMKNSLKFW